jgi:hypothetical protein
VDTPAHADDLLAIALERAGAMADAETPEAAVVIGTPNGRFLAVARISPTRVRFVNAAQRGTAEALVKP